LRHVHAEACSSWRNWGRGHLNRVPLQWFWYFVQWFWSCGGVVSSSLIQYLEIRSTANFVTKHIRHNFQCISYYCCNVFCKGRVNEAYGESFPTSCSYCLTCTNSNSNLHKHSDDPWLTDILIFAPSFVKSLRRL
jgi:hypothetical protein